MKLKVYSAENEKTKVVVLPSGRKTVPVKNLVEEKTGFSRDDQVSFVGIDTEKDYYSPDERAALIYEAITARDEKGEYLYHNIFLAGGNGADDTIDALEKLLQGPPKKELPDRVDNLNVFGFSDVSQFHHYLGQRGGATTIYYSNCNPEKISSNVLETLKKQEKNEQFSMELEVVNNPDNRKKIIGFTQPGAITTVEHKMTHQLQPFSNGSNMLVVELKNETQIERLGETLNQMRDKEISLVLSKDMSNDMVQKTMKAFPDMAIFYGALMGHGECKKTGEPIPLFACSTITIGDNGMATMNIDPKSSEKAKELQYMPKRIPFAVEDTQHSSTKLTIEDTDGAGRAVLSDLADIKQGAEEYTIHIKNAGPSFSWQKMELGIKELLEHGIINPDTLKRINFTGGCAENRLENLRFVNEVCARYLPKLEKFSYEKYTPIMDILHQKTKSTKIFRPNFRKNGKTDY